MRRPNFVLFITDQQRADHLGCNGNPTLRTPHLDALASRGVRFTRFHVATPICQPNRAALVTGQMPSVNGVRQNGIPLGLDSLTFAEVLRESGYRTGYIGKAHFQNVTDIPAPPRALGGVGEAPPAETTLARRHQREGPDYGWEVRRRWAEQPDLSLPTPYYGFEHVRLCIGHGDLVDGHYTAWLRERHPDPASLRGPANALPSKVTAPQCWRTALPEALYPTTYVKEQACEFLAMQDAETPFVLVVSFPDPHHPFTPPGRYWSLYDPDEVELPSSFHHPVEAMRGIPAPALEAYRWGSEDPESHWPFAVSERQAREIIARFGFDLDPDTRIDELPVGLQQQVEILKALFREARILIMDEPTAVLTPQETRGLFEFLRGYAAAGHAVVFISHKLDEVMEICDRMSVMRDGKMVGTVARADTDTRRLASMMVGREVLLRVDKGAAQPAEVRLEARGLRLRHPVKHKPILDDVDLQVRAGEIVGIAGIEGNGQTELVEVLTGLRTADAGTVSLDGRDVTETSARARREAGVSHVPEDRNERGLVRPYTAAWNAVLGDHHRAPYANRIGLLDLSAIDAHARAIIEGYDVRPRATDVLASSYSGGNAQKLIIARELERAPRVLVAAQPTRGVDIGAIEFIHRQIVKARDLGLAVLLVSADLNEVMSLSDRILVLFEGRVMGELPASEATAETLGLLMAGTRLDSIASGRPTPPAHAAGV